MCTLVRCVKKCSTACKTCRKSGSCCPGDQIRLWFTQSHSSHLTRTSATRCCMAFQNITLIHCSESWGLMPYITCCVPRFAHISLIVREIPHREAPLYLTELVQVYSMRENLRAFVLLLTPKILDVQYIWKPYVFQPRSEAKVWRDRSGLNFSGHLSLLLQEAF